MTKTLRHLLPLALSLILAACEQPGHAPHYSTQDAWRSAASQSASTMLTLATDAQSYAPGAPIVVRLSNGSRTRLGYNLCRASLDRNIDDDWRQVQPTLGEVCTAELRTLAPGQTATFSFRTDRQTRRGQYRIRSELNDAQGGTGVTALSNSFRVEGNDSD
jgi:hypothetical protein